MEYKFSIITVVKNDFKGLEKTIKSVRCQNYTDYEYIVIDGKSYQHEKFSRYADDIDILLSEEDSGIYERFYLTGNVVSS